MKKRKCVTSCDIGKRKLNYKNCTYNSKKKKKQYTNKYLYLKKKKQQKRKAAGIRLKTKYQ